MDGSPARWIALIHAFAIAMVPGHHRLREIREGKTGRKVGYVGIVCTNTPFNERFSLTDDV